MRIPRDIRKTDLMIAKLGIMTFIHILETYSYRIPLSVINNFKQVKYTKNKLSKRECRQLTELQEYLLDLCRTQPEDCESQVTWCRDKLRKI